MKTPILAIAALFILASTPASAGIVFLVSQVGGNVAVTADGRLNVTGSTVFGAGHEAAYIKDSGLAVGTSYEAIDGYALTANAGNFGTSPTFHSANFAAGDVFGLDLNDGFVSVPKGYLSGSALSGSATYDGQTFASLGLKPGQYGYAINGDTIQVDIGVPEPAAWVLFICGFGFIGMTLRRKTGGVAVLASQALA